jgi:hypothetical protein
MDDINPREQDAEETAHTEVNETAPAIDDLPQPTQQNISTEATSEAPAAAPPGCMDIEGTIYSLISLDELFKVKLNSIDADIEAKVSQAVDVEGVVSRLRNSEPFIERMALKAKDTINASEMRERVGELLAANVLFQHQVAQGLTARLADRVNNETTTLLNQAIDRIKAEAGQEYVERLAEMTAGRDALREGLGFFLLGDSIQEEVKRQVRMQTQEVLEENERLCNEVRVRQANLATTYAAITASDRLMISQLSVTLPYPIFPDLQDWAERALLTVEEANLGAPRRITKRTRPYTVGLLVSPELPDVDSRPAGNKLYICGPDGKAYSLREVISLIPPGPEVSTPALFSPSLLSALVTRHPDAPYTSRNLFPFYYPELSSGQRTQLISEAAPMCPAGCRNIDMLRAFHFRYEQVYSAPEPEPEIENSSAGVFVLEESTEDQQIANDMAVGGLRNVTYPSTGPTHLVIDQAQWVNPADIANTLPRYNAI